MSSNSGLNGRRSFPSPPHPSWTPCSVPTKCGCTVHFRGHVIVLCDLLLDGELPITLILGFVTNVSNASLLVFIDIEGSALHCRVLDFVRREASIEFLLLCRWRRVITAILTPRFFVRQAFSSHGFRRG